MRPRATWFAIAAAWALAAAATPAEASEPGDALGPLCSEWSPRDEDLSRPCVVGRDDDFDLWRERCRCWRALPEDRREQASAASALPDATDTTGGDGTWLDRPPAAEFAVVSLVPTFGDTRAVDGGIGFSPQLGLSVSGLRRMAERVALGGSVRVGGGGLRRTDDEVGGTAASGGLGVVSRLGLTPGRSSQVFFRLGAELGWIRAWVEQEPATCGTDDRCRATSGEVGRAGLASVQGRASIGVDIGASPGISFAIEAGPYVSHLVSRGAHTEHGFVAPAFGGDPFARRPTVYGALLSFGVALR